MSQFFFFKPHSFVEMVRCIIILYVRSTILPLGSNFLLRLKSKFYICIYLRVPLEKKLDRVQQLLDYLTKEYLAVASEIEMWITIVTYGVL